MTKPSLLKSYRFPIILLISIIIGSIIGSIIGEKSEVLKPLGDVFLNLMFTVVVPLVFFTIGSSITSMNNLQRLGKIIAVMLIVFIITGIIAASIMFITVSSTSPGANIQVTEELAEDEEKSIGARIVEAFTAPDFVELLSRKKMLALIIFTVIFGFSTHLVGGSVRDKTAMFMDMGAQITMKMVSLIMYYAPIGLAAYFAYLVGVFGPELVNEYKNAMLIYYPVTFLYFLIAFPLYALLAGGIRGLKLFVKYIPSPTVTSLATQSSIATLPVNLNAASNIGVPKDIRNIVLPMGATMHMDGTCLSTILKIGFLFNMFGKDFSGLGTFITCVLIAVLGGVVMSGIPGGGLVAEAMIVSIFGFPPESLIIIATIGYLVDPPATMVNATGDTVASMLVSRIVDGKNWIRKNDIIDENISN